AGELGLEDYAKQFAVRRITAGCRDDDLTSEAAPLFHRILGDAWRRLPKPVRDLHAAGPRRWRGTATVERGRGLISRLIGAVFRLPRTAPAVRLEVEIAPGKDGERWRRAFGNRHFSSRLSPGRGRDERLLVERFGPCAFGIALVIDGAALRYVVRRWS